MPNPRQRLAAALRAQPSGRCPDGCETTRALFPAAIERELDGAPPDLALYARLDRCPACDSTRLSAMLGEVVCRQCGHTGVSRTGA